MENIGSKLRKNRKEQGKTLEEINEQTKISLEHLNLLEKNDYLFLPETYVKSFIKNYAITLGLNGDEFDFSFIIKPSGHAAYFDFRELERGEYADSSELYICQ